MLAGRERTLPLKSFTVSCVRSSTLAATLIVTTLFAGCNRSHSHPGRHPLPPLIQASPGAPVTELVVDRQMKVVMGRPGSVEQISRVAQEIGPILKEAIDQESIQPLIQQDAAGAQKSVEDFKSYFVQKQEADI
ncbi:MAG: hypothetical protein M3Y56_09080, partial [Armatimonadota bacterium]|nr:hypothetical protein [Armatimonadota bacterium]